MCLAVSLFFYASLISAVYPYIFPIVMSSKFTFIQSYFIEFTVHEYYPQNVEIVFFFLVVGMIKDHQCGHIGKEAASRSF